MAATKVITAGRERNLPIVIGGGQLVSLLITAGMLFNSKLGFILAPANIALAFTQTSMIYASLLIFYVPYCALRYGPSWILQSLRKTWYVYVVLAAVDFYANYTTSKSYQYTNSLSAFLLNSVSTPLTVLISVIAFKARYRLPHYAAILICVAGLGIIVWQDVATAAGLSAAAVDGGNVVLGNVLALVSGLGYALANTLQEFTVKRLGGSDEYCIMMGFFGTIVSVIHMFAAERAELKMFVSIPQEYVGPTAGVLTGFVIANFLLYTVAPRYIGRTSATIFNISILTSNFFVLAGTVIFFGQQHITAWYIVGFICIVMGLFVFNLVHGWSDIFNKAAAPSSEDISQKEQEELARQDLA
ncbi:hypothetical protein RI367_003967 [Sorochytrium milnesiophthora]